MITTQAPAPPALYTPQAPCTISAVLPQLRAALIDTPFLRFNPSLLHPADWRFNFMRESFQQLRSVYRRVNSAEGIIFEAYDYHRFDTFEFDAFLLGAITYPRLTEVATLLASTISSRPVRAAVIGPGYFLQSAAVFSSLGFAVDVYDWDNHAIGSLESLARELPEELQSRISFNPVERKAVHVATWENPSSSDCLAFPSVDVVRGGFFLVQSNQAHAFSLFMTREWEHLFTKSSYLFPTSIGRIMHGFINFNKVDIFQRVANPSRRRGSHRKGFA